MNTPNYKPSFDRHGVGWCHTNCSALDGKRCSLLGFRPTTICEQWARQAAAERQALLRACKLAYEVLQEPAVQESGLPFRGHIAPAHALQEVEKILQEMGETNSIGA